MTVLLKVDRMQYGIGQGGFHAQQIRLTDLPAAVTVEPYRFVYDCGSDTGPLNPKQVKPLHWAIAHFAENDDGSDATPWIRIWWQLQLQTTQGLGMHGCVFSRCFQ